MGILIKINDAEFDNYVGIAEYPLLSSLQNLYFMGGTAAESIADHSGKIHDGTIVGTVVYNTNSATFSGTGSANRMTAQDCETSYTGITVISMFKKTGNRALVSYGTQLLNTLHLSPERLYYSSNADDAARNIGTSLAFPDSNNFYIGAWSLTPTEYSIYRDNTGSGLTKVSAGIGTGSTINGYTGTAAAAKKISFGGDYYSHSWDGTLDIAAVAFYDAALTEAQLKEAAEYLRGYGTKYGLTIN